MIKTTEAYLEYLKTDHWKKLRRTVIDRDCRRCTRCKSKFRLQAHHLFYRDKWEDSQPEDLITLCRLCHQKEHGLLAGPPLKIKPKPTFRFMHEVHAARSEKLITREEFNYWKKHFKSNGWIKPRKIKSRRSHRNNATNIKPLPVYYYHPPKLKWVNRGNSSN